MERFEPSPAYDLASRGSHPCLMPVLNALVVVLTAKLTAKVHSALERIIEFAHRLLLHGR